MNTKRFLTATAIAAAVVGSGIAGANVGGFDDVPDDHTHAAGIGWLVDNGITSGCDADSYCPDAPVTRAQMGTFFHRLSGNAQGIAPSVDATTVDGVDSADLVRSIERVSSSVQLTDDSFENVSVACPAGKEAIGGGYQIKATENGGLSSEWYAVADQAKPDGTGWTISVRTLDGGLLDAFVTVTATCAAV